MTTATLPDVCQLDPLPGFLPHRGISLLIGSPGVGKTALVADVLRRLRDGELIFGHQPNPVPAIGVVSADRGWKAGGAAWFARAGYADVRYYSMTDDQSFDPRILRKKWDRVSRLGELIDRLKLPAGSFVCIDPIGLFLGGNLNDYDTVACALVEVRRMLDQRALSGMLGLSHTAKLKADKNQRYLRLSDQVLGSAALVGFSDSLWYLAAPEELGTDHYQLLLQSHECKAESVLLTRDEQGLFVRFDTNDQGNCIRVIELFPPTDTAITFKGLLLLAQEIPLSRATLARVLDILIDRGRVERISRGTYRLKPEKTIH